MTLTLTITIVLALAGYLATYLNNALTEKRRQRLELTNKRLNNFYGPLFVAVEVARASVKGFFTTIGRNIDVDKDLPLTEPFNRKDEAEYRLWVENVFLPMNEWCAKVIRENAYLVKEKEMPACVLEFMSHVSTYQAITAKWRKKDYSQTYSVIPYPGSLGNYARESYKALKEEQLKLLERL
jgi:hypothetical protein